MQIYNIFSIFTQKFNNIYKIYCQQVSGFHLSALQQEKGAQEEFAFVVQDPVQNKPMGGLTWRLMLRRARTVRRLLF